MDGSIAISNLVAEEKNKTWGVASDLRTDRGLKTRYKQQDRGLLVVADNVLLLRSVRGSVGWLLCVLSLVRMTRFGCERGRRTPADSLIKRNLVCRWSALVEVRGSEGSFYDNPRHALTQPLLLQDRPKRFRIINYNPILCNVREFIRFYWWKRFNVNCQRL